MSLYAFGSNGSGQLGLGHENDLARPERNEQLESIGRAFDHAAAGGNHTLVLSNDGACYGAGKCLHIGQINEKGQEFTNNFMRVTSQGVDPMPHIRAISATWAASFLLGDNAIYVAGVGENGELGLGEDVCETTGLKRIPDFPPSGTRIVDLSSCMAHTIAVLSDGSVHGWGNGRKGQLGKPVGIIWAPRKIADLSFRVHRGVCGKDFTCLIGSPDQGQVAMLGPFGRDRFQVNANAPSRVPGWLDIVSSWGSVFILCASGKLVAWGRNDHGQLPPPSLPNVDRIAAGSEHSLALTKTGKVLAWGWGEHGNCGEHTDEHGDAKPYWNEIEIPGKIQGIFAGCATSFVTSEIVR